MVISGLPLAVMGHLTSAREGNKGLAGRENHGAETDFPQPAASGRGTSADASEIGKTVYPSVCK